MTEPASTLAVGASNAALIYLFGPGAPEMVLVLLASLVGALHPMGKKTFASGMGAAGFVLLWMATATVLTGVAVWALERYVGIPAARWPGVVAFGIAFLSDRWPLWLDQGIDFALRRKTQADEPNGERP